MREPPILEVDEEISKATNTVAENMGDESVLLKVSPPKEGNEGMDTAKSFLDSVHFLEMNRHFLISKKNVSPTCGMEIWYENSATKFMFHVPNETLAQEYRQQLSGYYDGCEIAEQTPNEGMFIRTDPEANESIAVSDIYLKKHYFSPLSSPTSEDNELDTDPFKRLISEIDSKDDTRVVFQVLYKPTPYNWTELQHTTLETYAERVKNKGGYKTRYWGLKVDRVDDPGIWESTASEIKSRLNKPAFNVDMRMCVVTTGQTQEKANKKAKSRYSAIMNQLQHLYETESGQKPVSRRYTVNKERNAKETLINIIKRQPSDMDQPKRIHEFIWERITPDVSTMVMTSGELSGFVHLPSPDAISSDSISWNDEMVAGNVPSDVDGFEINKDDNESELDLDKVREKLNDSDDDEEGTSVPDGSKSMDVLDQGDQ